MGLVDFELQALLLWRLSPKCRDWTFFQGQYLGKYFTVFQALGDLTWNDPLLTLYLQFCSISIILKLTLFNHFDIIVISWGKGLVDILPAALEYVEKAGVSVEENKKEWTYFTEKWNWYLDERGR